MGNEEILFKAKVKGWRGIPKEKWWVEGFYVKVGWWIGASEPKTDMIIPLNAKSVGQSQLIDPETICKRTEAIAIDGKKIFENDIVEESGTIGVVKLGKYGNGFHFGFYIEWIDCPLLRNELLFWQGKIKVVGNIFDNPELLSN